MELLLNGVSLGSIAVVGKPGGGLRLHFDFLPELRVRCTGVPAAPRAPQGRTLQDVQDSQ